MLRRRGVDAYGWDPATHPFRSSACWAGDPGRQVVRSYAPWPVVNLGFVLNVIEDVDERTKALKHAWRMTEKVLLVSVRTTSEFDPKEAVNRLGWRQFNDGFITSTGTFQRFYLQAEFQKYLESTLKKKVIMAAPGVAYVFRAKSLERLYLALRYPRPEHGPKTAPKRGKEKTDD